MQTECFEKFSLAPSSINKILHNIAAKEMDKYGLKGIVYIRSTVAVFKWYFI